MNLLSKPEDLGPNEIFVFGSNLAGRHGAGAAKTAHDLFGADYGVGFGVTGRCYAIPTKDKWMRTLPLDHIKLYVDAFLLEASLKEMHSPEIKYIVTPIGCGLAGYKPEQIAPFFRKAPENVILPKEFICACSTSAVAQ